MCAEWSPFSAVSHDGQYQVRWSGGGGWDVTCEGGGEGGCVLSVSVCVNVFESVHVTCR